MYLTMLNLGASLARHVVNDYRGWVNIVQTWQMVQDHLVLLTKKLKNIQDQNKYIFIYLPFKYYVNSCPYYIKTTGILI